VFCLLLTTGILSLPQESAYDVFEKIEQTIEKAESIRAKLSVDMYFNQGGRETKASMTGILLLKTGNKVSLRFKGKRDEVEHTSIQISDGNSVGGGMINMGKGIKDPSRMLHDCVRTSLSRTGAMAGIFRAGMAHAFLGAGEDNFKEEEYFTPYGFVLDNAADGTNTLSYKLEGGDPVVKVKVWYEPKTFRLLKRTLSWKTEGNEGRFTETYKEYVLNGKVPDEKFTLPKEE